LGRNETVIYTGCSYTNGTGFTEEEKEKYLWVNLLHNHCFSNAVKVNAGIPGGANEEIFIETVNQLLLHKNISNVFVEWTGVPRINTELGFELYSTRLHASHSPISLDVQLNDVLYSKEYLNSVKDRFISLIHPLYEITKIIKFSKILENLSSSLKVNVWFINGLCPWDKDFFKYNATITTPNEMTLYTQHQLNTENRDDEEIIKLYQKMHNNIAVAGGVTCNKWINLYQSMKSLQCDTNSDQVHPGVISNKMYANMIIDRLTEYEERI